MALVSFLDLIRHARQHSYALSVIPIENLPELFASITAAQNLRAPLILAPHVAPGADELVSRTLFAACEAAAQHASVPVALLARQGGHADELRANINLGCMALHIIAAQTSFPDAVAQTKALVQIAKQCGIAAGGLLQTQDSATNLSSVDLRTPVAEAVAFAERAELDFLEVQVGTQRSATASRSKIDFERLKRIHEASGLPFLIRCGDSLAPEQMHRLREHGIALVYHDNAPDRSDQYALPDLFNAWGSSGRAAEVLAHCTPWQLVEHVIEFNIQAEELCAVDDMLRIGREQLAAVPGVRRVVTGKALTEKAKYQFCWIITFANRKVVDYYRDHPIHVAFANNHFRPIASERITIDFER